MFKLRDKLAQIYVEKGHYQEAIQELREAIRITPAHPVPYINLTNILIKLGRHEDARKTCNRILELTGSASSKYSKYNEYAKNKLEFLSNLQDIGGTNTSDVPIPARMQSGWRTARPGGREKSERK
jgi:tetratricopeptide (TPR) repeat protein